MDVIVLIGRILFAALFLSSAFGHFTQTEAMSGYAKARGVPFAREAVLGGGVLLLFGGLSILLGVWPDLGALALVVFLIPTAVMIHGFWRETDPTNRQMEMIQFQKDTALAGAALMLFAFFAYVGDDLGLTLTGPAFNLS
jgi:putative oxidoreductase